jgi:hypothetical protein
VGGAGWSGDAGGLARALATGGLGRDVGGVFRGGGAGRVVRVRCVGGVVRARCVGGGARDGGVGRRARDGGVGGHPIPIRPQPVLRRQLGQAGADFVELVVAGHAHRGRHAAQGLVAAHRHAVRLGAQHVGYLVGTHSAPQRQVEQRSAGGVELPQGATKGVGGHP